MPVQPNLQPFYDSLRSKSVPEPSAEIEVPQNWLRDVTSLDPLQEDRQAQLVLVLSGEAFRQKIAYPVIVEAWDRKQYGRQRRAWEKEFTVEERRTVARYYDKFYKWYLVSGTPDRVSCRVSTLQLLERAVALFATF